MKFLVSWPVTKAIATILCVMAIQPATFAARVRASRTATPPAAPSNLQAIASSTSSVRLTWTDNSKNEGVFIIENASSSSGPWTRTRVLAVNTTSYTKSNLTSGATYYFRVRAANRQGDSANSNIASTSLDGTTPPAPGNLSAAAASTSQINLSWSDNSANETGFDLESATSASGPWAPLASVNANATSYAAAGLSANQTYHFRAHAKNAEGDSPYSNTANATTQSTTPPPPPPTTAAGMAKGIYLLDDKSAPSRTGSMRQADKPYIDGFTWRMPWTSFDTGVSAPSYNFSAVATAVSSLQALTNNKNNRMKLTLALFNQEVPQYVLNSSQNTYTTDATGASGSVLTVLPWDSTGLQHFRNFVHALAEYKVYDAMSGQTVAFRDHPALGQIDAGILGMQSYRDIRSFAVVANAGYTREKFVQAVLDCVHAVRDEFPNKNVYMGFFSMDDDTRSPSLDSEVLAAMKSEFDGVKNPHVGFFQELLRGDAPSMNGDYGKNLLTGGLNGSPVLFQACSPWINKSLCTFTAGDDTPENGFNNGYNNYGALYYEMYAADLAEPSWQSMFQQWHDFLQAQ